MAGPFMPAWCLICAALLACLSPAPPTKSLDLSLTLTNNVIHVNDVPEHLLTMYPVCTPERVPTSGVSGASGHAMPDRAERVPTSDVRCRTKRIPTRPSDVHAFGLSNRAVAFEDRFLFLETEN